MQLLFLYSRVRCYIHITADLLTTRFNNKDTYKWGKLNRVLNYLKGTEHMKLNLTVNYISTTHWWVDASYKYHAYSSGHTGSMMSLGHGALIVFDEKETQCENFY